MKNTSRLIFGASFLFALIISSIFLPNLFSSEQPKEASFYQKLKDNIVQCQLCPRRCTIPEGLRGYCRTRENRKGVLYTLVYAKPVAIHIDPIEKKPLFHFLPSAKAYSIATAGCNLKCKFCQNWEISQSKPEELEYIYLTPADLIKKVKEKQKVYIKAIYNSLDLKLVNTSTC